MSTESSRESGPRLTLLVRSYCHLCDEMREALAPVLGARGATLEVIDVDGDRELEARWGDKIPVLLAGERELCHHRLDRTVLAAWLADMLR
ncbi:MAG TPA: glutaredoxin family protein [Casimicrobiaceae bacterium]|nr:glutaredoxin family protein [Casimicrobiaceae bacterium]